MRLPVLLFIFVLIAACAPSLAKSESDLQLSTTLTASVARAIQKRAAFGLDDSKVDQFANLLQQLRQIPGADQNSVLDKANHDFDDVISNYLPSNLAPVIYKIPIINIAARFIETAGGVPSLITVTVLRLVTGVLKILVS